MRYHTQTIRHDPANGQYGDCFRTALACIMDLEPEEVPHFFDGASYHGPPEVAWRRVGEWLCDRGLVLFTVPFNPAPVDGILEAISTQNPGVYFLFSGHSGVANHQVIAANGRIVHDPSSGKGGIIGPCDDGYYWVNLLLPRIHMVTPFD
jgi:hypothetical protein